MKPTTKTIFDDLTARYPKLQENGKAIIDAYNLLYTALTNGKKVLLCGNGGSAADCEHIVGELMKCFKKKRPVSDDFKAKLLSFGEDGKTLSDTLEGSMRAISLTSHIALSTAFANDREPSVVFAQQLFGLGDSGDVLIAISTSGNSKNCVYAAEVAVTLGLKVIALTGHKDSRLSALADCSIKVAENETYKIQELHLPVYHALCAMLEEELF